MSLTSWLRNLRSIIGPGRAERQFRSNPLHRRPAAKYRSLLELLEARALPSTLTVINTNDSGAGSLRQAIIDANALAGPDVIDFSIGSGAQTIQVGSTTGTALPTITDSVTIAGTSQPGYSGTPLIVGKWCHFYFEPYKRRQNERAPIRLGDGWRIFRANGALRR